LIRLQAPDNLLPSLVDREFSGVTGLGDAFQERRTLNIQPSTSNIKFNPSRDFSAFPQQHYKKRVFMNYTGYLMKRAITLIGFK
jgi:hypothetical protein